MIGSGNVTLVDIRNDLDLTGDISLYTERAVRDKACNWDGDITLTEFRNNVLGQQNEQGGANRHVFEPASYAAGVYNGGVEDWPPDTTKKCIRLFQQRTTNSDAGSEARCRGLITEAGQYRLSGWTQCTGNSSAGVYGQIAVVVGSTGWLAGSTTVKTSREVPAGNNNSWSSPLINLDTSQPYVSVIFYAIARSYATLYLGATQYFQGMKLEKQ